MRYLLVALMLSCGNEIEEPSDGGCVTARRSEATTAEADVVWLPSTCR